MVQARQTQPPASGLPSERLVAALFAVGAGLKRMQYDEPVEKAALGVLHRLQCGTGAHRLSDLANELHLDLSTVSRHVRQLEDAGLVVRAEDPEDRRAHQLALTEAGTAALADAMQARIRRIDRVLAEWSEEDRETLAALLTRLGDDIAADLSAEGGRAHDVPRQPSAAAPAASATAPAPTSERHR